MIRIPVEVRKGDLCFEVTAWAESVERAVKLVQATYPGREVSVIFPIEPDYFFADRDSCITEVVSPRISEDEAV